MATQSLSSTTNNSQEISSFQCQRCRVALLPHKSLTDLKPAQLNLLTSSLQLSVDSKKKQQRQPKYQNNTKNPNKNTGFWSNWPDESTVPHAPWGLSNLPGDAYSSLLGRSGSVGSFVAVPDSETVQKELGKSEHADLYLTSNNNREAASPKKQDTAKKETTKDKDETEFKKDSRLLYTNTSALEKLFEVISSKSDIDYPVCMDCAEVLRDKLKQKYEDECRERDAYIAFAGSLKAEANPAQEDIEQLQKEVEQLELKNSNALQELKEAEKVQEQLELELKELEKKFEGLKDKEEEYFEKRNEFQLEIDDLESESDRTGSMLEQEVNILTKLQAVNVYNDVFCIGFDGYFGTINGLRLGRLKDRLVEWSEINAAWGQTLLCLTTVINKLDYSVIGYKLHPQGSISVIEKLDIDHKSGEILGRSSYELFSSGDYRLGRILIHKRLDTAMVAFLAVLKQVCDFAQSQQPNFRVPYHINNDKIGEYSIRLSINSSNDAWTKACKYVLINLKHVLAFATV